MSVNLYRHVVSTSIFLLMLCPFVFSHALYSSRPLLRLILILLPLVITGIAYTRKADEQTTPSTQNFLLLLVGLNLLWEFVSCFWSTSFSAGVREMSASLVLFLLVLAFSALRQTVSAYQFKRSIVLAASILLILVFCHTIYAQKRSLYLCVT